MTLLALLMVAQPASAPPLVDPEACAPVYWQMRSAPPPPAFSAFRAGRAPRARVTLSVHRCGGGEDGYHVRRHRDSGHPDNGLPMDWVRTTECPALLAWVRAVERLRLPSPMLDHYPGAPRGDPSTQYSLQARITTGSGWPGQFYLHSRDPEGAPPSALSGWIEDGLRGFEACRAQGLGGEGFRSPYPPRRPR